MCYSSRKDFGWGIEKKDVREPRERESKPAEYPEPRVTAEDSRLRDFINRRRVRKAVPVVDRTREKV
ncbi:hypothetical protein ACFQ36_11065 [Arthrobacter sp. GCM10027362]|uniref:hypothetical protein n=1 Tax=Arthrobacter sp. GCM10027362 TaxID=3273379 RepID=UPI00362E86C9